MNHDYLYGFARMKYIIFFAILISYFISKMDLNLKKNKYIVNMLIIFSALINLAIFFWFYGTGYNLYL